MAAIFLPDGQHLDGDVAGGAAVIGGAGQGVAHHGHVARDADGLVGQGDGNKVRRLVHQRADEARLRVHLAARVPVAEQGAGQAGECGLVRVHHGNAQLLYDRSHGLLFGRGLGVRHLGGGGQRGGQGHALRAVQRPAGMEGVHGCLLRMVVGKAESPRGLGPGWRLEPAGKFVRLLWLCVLRGLLTVGPGEPSERAVARIPRASGPTGVGAQGLRCGR